MAKKKLKTLANNSEYIDIIIRAQIHKGYFNELYDLKDSLENYCTKITMEVIISGPVGLRL